MATTPETTGSDTMTVQEATLRASRLAMLRSPRLLFWLGFAALLIIAAVLRTFRLDMPPIDFPADRQKTNCAIINMLLRGHSLFSLRSAWLELWILPWVTARTSFLCSLFGCELWTLARAWSALFGLVTVGMAAYAGYWAAATAGSGENRRRRLALLFMAAMAFNPYHVTLSRIITTESATLAFQMCAVGFFWAAWRNPRRPRLLALFLVFFLLSGWAKIPSLIWLPAFVLYFLVHPTYDRRPKLALLGACALATLAVFWVYKLNPFTMLQSYTSKNSFFSDQSAMWMGNRLWTQTYLSRILHMLTLPGAFFAVVGLLRAPWLFRITAIVFLALFYPLVNLNLYNFCHIIIPGMALAAWGANSFLEAAAAESLLSRHQRLQGWPRRCAPALGPLLIVLVVVWLAPLGPAGERAKIAPRADILQAARVINRIVPQGIPVPHDDAEGALSFMLHRHGSDFSRALDLGSGYYYSIERFTDKPIRYTADAWVRWASLPGEPAGQLFTTPPAPPAAETLKDFTRVAAPAAPQPSPLQIESCYLPSSLYDPANQTLTAEPGTSVTIGIAWNNDGGAPLAAMRWHSETWNRHLPPPIREGGLAVMDGAVLCLPKTPRGIALYTFEIPDHFPLGAYTLNFYAHGLGRWNSLNQPGSPVPFRIVCAAESAQTHAPKTQWFFSQIYPALHDRQPFAWSGHWFYRNMRFEGYWLTDAWTGFLACPLSPPGVYELTLRGEATPVTSPDDPAETWPVVEIVLPGAKDQAAARAVVNASDTRSFRVTFTATEPFDALLLKASAGAGAAKEFPLWPLDFAPAAYGKPTLTLREATLESARPLHAGQ